MRAAPKEQPKTTEAIASELIGGRPSSSGRRYQDLHALWFGGGPRESQVDRLQGIAQVQVC